MGTEVHRLQKKHLDALSMYAQLIQEATAHLDALMKMEATPELPSAGQSELPLSAPAAEEKRLTIDGLLL